ncbi:MAG: VWA domain-containing protein [Candidatus Limnocylindrales bacterium]
MREAPLAHRHAVVAGLILSLLAGLAPVAVQAQGAEAGPTRVQGQFAVRGSVAEVDIVYAWEVTDEPTGWRVELEGPADASMRVQLSGGDEGPAELVDQATGPSLAMLNDLRLEPGTWYLSVVRQGADPVPFELRARPEPEAFDPEPNATMATAVALADGDEIRGRLGRTDLDEDLYRLSVPSGEPTMRDVVLEWSGGPDRRLCLLDEEGRDVVCRSGEGVAALFDLLLDRGEHYFAVDGSEDADAPYRLRVEPGGPPPADGETEPNDDVTSASPFEARLGVRGRSSREDPDFHRVDITGDPQLWRVQASGDELERLSWIRGGVEVMAATPEDGAARLVDLYLVPGRHVFRVRTLGGDYELQMTPLGPPDADAEREPNDEAIRAQAYAIGERRVGRLATAQDLDEYRFTLTAQDHVRLDLEQPGDALFEVRLYDDDGELVRAQADEAGAALRLDLWLHPGDYRVSVRPQTPSEGQYALASERLDPFVLAADQEPNEDPVNAREAPTDLRWEGRADAAGDLDATWLPPLEGAGPVSIRLEGGSSRARLFAGDFEQERLTLEQQEDGSWMASDVPGRVPLYLEILADAAYRVELESPGWRPQDRAEPPSLELRIELPAEPIAAYWPEAQRVEGTIVATNAGDADLSLEIETVTSHYAWEARPAVPEMDLPAGTTQELPLEVRVRPDAWAGLPVRVSVAARDVAGGQVTASTELAASPDAPAVGTTTGWDVPAALLGGLDVASIGVGGVSAGTVSPDREPFLHDGVTPEGAGFGVNVSAYPLELVVDLAGDEPVSVRGTVLDPLARGFQPRQVPDEFELLLSTDGSEWESVLTDRLLTLPIDQPFLLDEPRPATHAMLRIHSDHSARRRSGVVALGEWKVIAEPGTVPESMPANIADPVRGGHVVRVEPFSGGLGGWYQMLDEELRRQELRVDRDAIPPQDRFELVIGFQDGRAAQITELRWQDPEGSEEEARLTGVAVDASIDGPLGPWEPLGDWQLDRGSDGSVTPFRLKAPAWARYLRISSPLGPEARSVEAPARIEVLERAVADDYRSILGEWGKTSRQGPLEWLTASVETVLTAGPDAGDTRATATPLAMGIRRTDRAEILEDVDWYGIEVAPGSNSLSFEVGGVPVPDVRLTLFDAAGSEVPMRLSPVPGGSQRYEADVEPGSYDLLVEQVPFNVAFTFDTSGSMGPFLDFVLEGMRAFAADVQPGREVATILPFGYDALLDTWQDQPGILEDAVNNWLPGTKDSSDAEESLLKVSQLLADREGTRAILVVTDAESGSFDLTPQWWTALEEVSPVVYSVHVGASNEPFRTRNLMRSWADANGGHYAFPATHAEMERAFERMSTRLRRPAFYTLDAAATFVDRSPGELVVAAPEGAALPLAPGVGIGIILDTSGSMRKRLEGKRRIAVAKASMRQLIDEGLAAGVPVSLRVFGGAGKKSGCETRQLVELGPLRKARTIRLVDRLTVKKNTGTPIAAALREIRDDLAEVEGQRIVVLITDGKATCKEDPEAALAELREAGFEINLNIVGFALGEDEVKEQMRGWAEANAGRYYDAVDARALTEAITAAVAAPVDIYAARGEGALVASTTVGAPPLELPPGEYRVEVRTDPPVELEDVVVRPSTVTEIELPIRPAQ